VDDRLPAATGSGSDSDDPTFEAAGLTMPPLVPLRSSWNCKGLANTSTIRSLRSIIRNNHLDILFLSETKTDPAIASSIMHQLGFRGGLLLA
jgi:hypothetical protein